MQEIPKAWQVGRWPLPGSALLLHGTPPCFCSPASCLSVFCSLKCTEVSVTSGLLTRLSLFWGHSFPDWVLFILQISASVSDFLIETSPNASPNLNWTFLHILPTWAFLSLNLLVCELVEHLCSSLECKLFWGRASDCFGPSLSNPEQSASLSKYSTGCINH